MSANSYYSAMLAVGPPQNRMIQSVAQLSVKINLLLLLLDVNPSYPPHTWQTWIMNGSYLLPHRKPIIARVSKQVSIKLDRIWYSIYLSAVWKIKLPILSLFLCLIEFWKSYWMHRSRWSHVRPSFFCKTYFFWTLKPGVKR